ncbi:MAG: hypothetical protein LBT21_02250, partial [Oscillospiraceae bacterium]|nr:hypothetical protein [Oscillospiraceae bacterium]
MKNIAKLKTKWLLAAVLCLVGLLTAGALLLPYISNDVGAFSQILHLSGDADTPDGGVLEDPPVMNSSYAVRLVGEALPGGNEVLFGEYSFPATVGETLTQAQILAQIGELPNTTGFTLTAGADFTVPADGQGVVTINYTRNKYALKFYGYNNEVFSNTLVPFGGAVTAPIGEPQRTGYHFAAWIDFPQGEALMGAEPLSFYAQFSPNTNTPFTLVFVGEMFEAGQFDYANPLGTKAMAGTTDLLTAFST